MFVWLRVPGDVVFAIGGMLLGVYALRLLIQPRRPARAPTLVLARKS
jgi:nitric oxide reductase subunit B